jgi:ABC-type transport system involved in multi-copper enzyme maturation permease subunit
MKPSLLGTVGSEWTKLRTVRSTWLTLGIALVVSVGLSVLFTFAAASQFDKLSVDQRTNFDAAGTSLVGVNLGLILFAVLGVLVVSAEYASGMMQLTLSVTPRRARVLVAKGAVVMVLSFVSGLVYTAIAFFAGQAVLRGYGVPSAGLGSPGVVRGLLGWGLAVAAFSLIAMSLGILLRSAAGAIATSIGLIFAPVIVSGLLPTWVRHNILAYLPDSAASNLSSAQLDHTSATYLTPGAAFAILAVWVGVLLMTAYSVMKSRDSG